MKTNVVITIAAPEDTPNMQEVFYKTWLATYPNESAGITTDDIKDFFKNEFTEEILKKRADRLKNPPEGEKIFLAKKGSQIIGVCRVIKRSAYNQLQAIYILPEEQGNGTGTMLWNIARNFFDEKDVVVNVATYNKNAIAFYKNLGFRETGKFFENPRFKMKSGAMIPEMEMRLLALTPYIGQKGRIVQR